MAVHDKFADLAERLIAKHGRPMNLRRFSRTPDDALKPWRGPDATDLAGYEFDVEVTGVVIDYEVEEIDDDHVKRGDKRLLIAAKPSEGTELLGADSVLDDSQVYSIVRGNLLKPGITRILFDFQLRQ